LKKEQGDDESKKGWCIAEVDKTEDDVKWTARAVSDVGKVIASSNEDLKAILAEIAAVTKGIKELDASVEAATLQRKAEHSAAQNSIAECGTAKELLQMAKNRLNKYYNPKLVEAPPKKKVPLEERFDLLQKAEPADGAWRAARQDAAVDSYVSGDAKKEAEPVYDAELLDHRTGEDYGDEAPTFVQVNSQTLLEDQETVDDASTSDSEDESVISDADFAKEPIRHEKQEGSSGVLEMLNMLKEDVSKQIQEMEFEEKDAQKDYEVFMKDSSDKRAIDSKAVADKESTKAKIETELQKAKVKLAGEQGSLMESRQELYELHNDCDWLIKNFDARKSAREDETDALTKARAVLSGADYS